MNFSVTRFKKETEEEWDEFVENSNNGTIFHLRKFLSYHIERKFDDHSLIFKKNNNIIAVFPAAEVLKNGEKVLHSHPGASFGGFVFKQKISFQESEKIIKLFEKYCFNKFSETYFVPSPAIYSFEQCDTFEYLLLWNNYHIVENYISSVIDITNSKAGIIKKIHSRKRRYIQNISKIKDLNFKWENNFNQFYPILLKNKTKHNIKPTHTLKELQKINELLPKKLHLLILYYDNKPIGGTLNFIANSKVGVIFYNMIDYEYLHLQPAALQIFETMKWAKKYGLSYLDFGVSQIPQHKNPLTPNPSLIRFKEQFGSRGMIRKAFRKKFNT